MICLNLCELLNSNLLVPEFLDSFCKILKKNKINKLDRIYLGSYFCPEYFLGINFWNDILKICRKFDLPITLVIPVTTQKNLQRIKTVVSDLIKNNQIIDEITVNDYGMLHFIKNKFNIKINAGRLFVKNPRDIRLEEYFNNPQKPDIPKLILEDSRINTIELDPMNKTLDLTELNTYHFSIHIPLCYQSTGNVCRFSSLHKPLEKKFRVNPRCQYECSNVLEEYNYKGRIYIHLGKTAYFFNPFINQTDSQYKRIIYFPIFEIFEALNK